jgi:hypothetical protein
MPGKDIITIQISIDGKNLVFDKNNDPGNIPFDTGENDADGHNVRIELGIAKVFHKVLNFIKTDPELFQRQDFELLGEMLAKIIFGKQGDMRGVSMRETYQLLRAGVFKNCRLILSFDGKSGMANLPWEYVLYKFRGSDEPFYLSASVKSCFQVIRRFPTNVRPCIHPEQEKLHIIVLLNTEGNNDANPVIDSRGTEKSRLRQLFDSLKQQYPDKVEIKMVETPNMEDIKEEVENTVTAWRNGAKDEPAWILHYIGHAMLQQQIGKLAIKPKPAEKINWVKDTTFASLFSSDSLDVRQPSIVSFQACDSAKIGVIDNNLRGVGYEFTKVNIPAVVGMQNEINAIQSCAFYYKVYECLLAGHDVAEAVTIGRDHLGTDHKDYAGQEFQLVGEPYKYNFFGSPVLFITTDEPVRMIRTSTPSANDVKTDGNEMIGNTFVQGRTAKSGGAAIDNDNPEKASRAE